jgi:hypothetical protein
VQAGQVTVQYDDVVVVHAGPFEGAVAVEGHVDGHGLPTQASGDGLGQHPFVLDHKHAHWNPFVATAPWNGTPDAGGGCVRPL